MLFAGEKQQFKPCSLAQFEGVNANNNRVTFHGSVHKIRRMGDIAFVLVRCFDGVFQCVWSEEFSEFSIKDICEEVCAEFEGELRSDTRAPHGFEVRLKSVRVLSRPAAGLPVTINKGGISANLDARLNYRSAVLRSPQERAKFRLGEGLVRAFRDFLHENGFTEIHSPKIVAACAEGGANVFKLNYFGRKAYLAQSPQFYKQAMVGVFGRVFETGPVFRAEKHSTVRHLNEYTSLDFEMGYIDSFYDIIEMETGFLKYAMKLLKKDYSEELGLLKVRVPDIDKIPCVRFSQVKELVSRTYSRPVRDPNDLEPEEEQLAGRLFKEEYGSDFVFITHYPAKKRPFYAMNDPEDPKLTLSFDLLFRGLEVTTGGQRIHGYDEQVEKMLAMGLDPADFESYLMLHKYGAPPHGGLGIGLERLLMKLLNEDNVRSCSLFPRDISRIEP